MTRKGEYQCANCGGVFTKGWTDEEATAEAVENGFGGLPQEEFEVVCEDCYQAIMSKCHDGPFANDARRRVMEVRELIRKLEELDPFAVVMVHAGTGGYMQADSVDEKEDEGTVYIT